MIPALVVQRRQPLLQTFRCKLCLPSRITVPFGDAVFVQHSFFWRYPNGVVRILLARVLGMDASSNVLNTSSLTESLG